MKITRTDKDWKMICDMCHKPQDYEAKRWCIECEHAYGHGREYERAIIKEEINKLENDIRRIHKLMCRGNHKEVNDDIECIISQLVKNSIME